MLPADGVCNERCCHKEEEGEERNQKGTNHWGRAGVISSAFVQCKLWAVSISLPLLTAPLWHFDLQGCEQFIKNGSRSKWACNAQPLSGNLNGSLPIFDKVKCSRRQPGTLTDQIMGEIWMLTSAVDPAGVLENIRDSFTGWVYIQLAWSCRLPPSWPWFPLLPHRHIILYIYCADYYNFYNNLIRR